MIRCQHTHAHSMGPSYWELGTQMRTWVPYGFVLAEVELIDFRGNWCVLSEKSRKKCDAVVKDDINFVKQSSTFSNLFTAKVLGCSSLCSATVWPWITCTIPVQYLSLGGGEVDDWGIRVPSSHLIVNTKSRIENGQNFQLRYLWNVSRLSYPSATFRIFPN